MGGDGDGGVGIEWEGGGKRLGLNVDGWGTVGG